MLLKEIKEDQTKYRNIPYLLIGIFSTLKMSALPRFTYRFSAIPIRIRADFLNIEIDICGKQGNKEQHLEGLHQFISRRTNISNQNSVVFEYS